MKFSSKFLGVLILCWASNPFAWAADLERCWIDRQSVKLLDVDGNASLQGAWSIPAASLFRYLEEDDSALTVLLSGYDLRAAQRVCEHIVGLNHEARILFGGRERVMAEQQQPPWDWLLVSAETIAAHLLEGSVEGFFVGTEKAVVGKGLSRTDLTDPGRLAAWLMDGSLARHQPVVLFVDPQHQQQFFEFFSNNLVPGVFLSFETPDKVKDVLNQHASIAAFGAESFPAYICR